MEEKIKKLPKWAQTHIKDLERQIAEANQNKDTIMKMHAIMCDDKNRGWFTLGNHIKGTEPMKLWLLDKDSPFPVCSLDPKDILFVGRAGKNA